MRQYQKQLVPPIAPNVHPMVRWVWKQINMQQVSQEDLAKRSGVATSTFRKWRTGVRSPRIIELEAIINALGYKLIIKENEE